MPVSAIPFKMPVPMELPSHIVDGLRRLPPDRAVEQGMELLMQIDAAQNMVYERLGQGGVLELGHVKGERSDALKNLLQKAGLYGRRPGADGLSFAEQALAKDSALLIMGQARAEEKKNLPTGMVEFLLEGAANGSIGFSYVLPLRGSKGNFLGALTLIRGAASGPLNHEQPNIVEAMRRELSRILEG
jgi:hypothetical protein